MKLGIRCHDYGRLTPEDLAARLKADGFSAAHLAPYKALDLDGDFLEERNLARVKAAMENAGIEIAVLGCYVDPGSLDDSVWAQSLDRFEKHLRAAKYLGARCVGTETTHFLGTDAEREPHYERVLAFVKKMVSAAQEADSVVGIEPVFRHTICSPKLVKRLIGDVQSPRLQIIFDPVNLLWEGNTASQDALFEEAIQAFGGRVAVMHIKDGVYHGNDYTPRPLGQGVVKYDAVAPWLKHAHPHITLIRDEADEAVIPADIQYMRDVFMR